MRATLTLILFTLLPALAQANGIPVQTRQWLAHYYQHPEPERIGESLTQIRTASALGDMQDYAFLTGFLYTAIQARPESVIRQLGSLKNLSETERSPLLQSAWLSNTDEGKSYLKNWGGAALQREFGSDLIAKIPPPNPLGAIKAKGDVLFYWGHFAASGDRQSLQRVVDASLGQIQGKGSKPEEARAIAESMLVTALTNDENVRQFCKDELARASGERQSALAALLDKAGQARP